MPRKRVTLEEAIEAIKYIETKFALKLRDDKGLFDLDLSGDNIENEGAGLLAKAIKETTAPLILDLSYSKIGDDGAKLLAEAIMEAQAPLKLDLDGNDIGYQGVEALAKAIKVALVPISLCLKENIIIDTAQKLFDNAKVNNFVVDAAENLETFNERIGSALRNDILKSESRDSALLKTEILPMVLHADAVCDIALLYSIYERSPEWVITATIRATPYASYGNEYSSINRELFDFIYNDVPSGTQQRAKKVFGRQFLDKKLHGVLEEMSSIPSSREIMHHKLTQYLLPLSLIKPIHEKPTIPQGYDDVPGDGLCFYHAIASQLRIVDYNNPNDSEEDREMVAQVLQQLAIHEILNHSDRYEAFVFSDAYQGLEGFLNYHLRRQDSNDGGWGDYMIAHALANALGQRIRIELFDHAGNPEQLRDPHGYAIGDAPPIVIDPHHITDDNVLRIGNIGNIHFVSEANGLIPALPAHAPTIILASSFAPTAAPTLISEDSPTSNATSQVYYEALEFDDASSFEFVTALILSGMDSVIGNSN